MRAILLALLFVGAAAAQTVTNPPRGVPSGSALPSICTPVGGPQLFFLNTGANKGLYECLTANTWSVAAGAQNVTTLPATCTPGGTPNLVFLTAAYSTFSVGLYQCTATNIWSYLAAAGYGNLSCTYASTTGCTVNTATLGATTVDQIVGQCYTVSGSVQTPATISNYTATVSGGIVTLAAFTTASSGTGYCVVNANGASLPSNAVLTVNAIPGPNPVIGKVEVGLGNVVNLNQTNASNLSSGQVNVPVGVVVYCADASGSGTTYTCTGTPAPATYQTSLAVTFVPQTTSSTTTPTLNINSLGAKGLKATASTNLTSGQLVAGSAYQFTYDGTEFVLAGGGQLSLTTTGTTGAAAVSGNTLNVPVYQGALTLTTTGTTGASTLSGNTLNIPQYSAGGTSCVSIASASYPSGNTTVTDSLGLATPFARQVSFYDATGLAVVGIPTSGLAANSFTVNLASGDTMFGISCGAGSGSCSGLSWAALTNGQWTGLTNLQWTGMCN